jgi:hypothetical protein
MKSLALSSKSAETLEFVKKSFMISSLTSSLGCEIATPLGCLLIGLGSNCNLNLQSKRLSNECKIAASIPLQTMFLPIPILLDLLDGNGYKRPSTRRGMPKSPLCEIRRFFNRIQCAIDCAKNSRTLTRIERGAYWHDQHL